MMKLFTGEIQDLVTGSGKFKLLFLLFFIHPVIYSQVSINGFCKYNTFQIDSGYTSLFQINFNNDAYTDLILFNPEKKDITVLKGDINGTFKSQEKYQLPIPVSNLENIINTDNVVTGYFFTSRRTLKAGTIKFNESGRPQIDKEIKLSSYPEYISVRDYNLDNKPEYLISGSAFNGISVISEKDNKLVERKLINEGSYSKAIFADISNDGYSDIAALNIMTNSLDLFYNNAAGGFYKVRSLPFENKITGFKLHDVDLDGYEDIIISQGRGIKIFYGDYTSSFTAELVIKTDFIVESFLTADYNKDGLIDIAYLDKKNGIISIVFASASREYHNEILYLKKNNLEKLTPFYSKFVNGIIALSSTGKLYFVTNLISISDNINITAGVMPSVIKYFDYNNDGIIDYAYLDEFDQKLKIIIRNRSGIPAYYYSYPLFSNYSDFIIENVSSRYKRFYCYSSGAKLIEIIDADLEKSNFRRSSLYSPGNIFDIKPYYNSEKNSELIIAFSSGGKLGISKVTRENLKYVFNTTMGISSNIIDAWFSKENSNYIYFWSRQNTNMTLAGVSYNHIFDDIKIFGSIKLEKDCRVTGISGNLLNNAEDHLVTFLSCGNDFFTISASDSIFLSLTNTNPGETAIKNRKQLFCGEIRFNGLKRLLSYNPYLNKIYNVNFINNGRKIITTELMEAPAVNSFFIKNMSFRNYHLVYTNSQENCITIMQL